MRSDPRHPRVLVIDDDEDTREMYDIMLGTVGYRVATAGGVHPAAAALARETPDVVVTDWRLPDGDGFAVADIVRSHGATRQVPLVAVTGVNMPAEMAAEAKTRGFTSILLKPVTPDVILASVRLAAEIGTARRLRVAARRLSRYAARVRARLHDARGLGPEVIVDSSTLLDRAARRSGDDVTLMLADNSAHYVAAAGSTRELTGYDPEELLALSVWDLTPTPNKAAGQGHWNTFLASGTDEGRYLLRRRDGAPIEAQYCAIANVMPGLHVSALAPAIQVPGSL